MKWTDTITSLTDCLRGLVVTDADGQQLDADTGYLRLCEISRSIRKEGGTIFLAGNGASASMASHVAADLAKNALIRTEVFSDLALITAVANDLSYDQVFAEPLKRRMKQGDLFVAISSSGNSPNVLNAAIEARKLGGHVVTLSAMQRTNRLIKTGDINFYLPGDTYGMAESGHATVLHHWIDTIVADCAS